MPGTGAVRERTGPRRGSAGTIVETMADPLYTIAATLREAFAAVTGMPAAGIDPVVRPSDRADAQANGALALAK